MNDLTVHPFHARLSKWCADFPSDIYEAKHIVLLDRYLGGERFGVHAVSPRTDGHPHYKFRSRTIGLLGKDDAEALKSYARSVCCYSNESKIQSVEDPELIDYIGGNIIPIEWKREFAQRDQTILSAITVLT